MAKTLTGPAIDRAKPRHGQQYELLDEKIPSLALRVSPSGVKSWTLRYRTRVTGDQRRLTLGRYPAVGLSKARLIAQEMLGAVAGGEDPAKQKRVARAASQARKLSTVAGLIESYLEDAAAGRHKPNGRPKRQSTLDLQRYYFDRLVKPRFGNLTVDALDRHTLQKFLDEVGQDGPSNARHCRDVIREAFNYAIRREVPLVGRNPAQFASVLMSTERERVLSEIELKTIWTALEQSDENEIGIAPTTRLALLLALVTLQRGGEVAGIHARELDRTAKLWTIPGTRAKNHRTHSVPLSTLAVDILDRAFAGIGPGRSREWSGFAFPSPRGKEAMMRSAMSKAVKRLTDRLGIANATLHDFRRTGSTFITGERIGIPRFIVSRVINQTSDSGGAAKVTGVYDRNEYLPEKRRALDAWASVLANIVRGETPASNIVPITQGRVTS